MELLHALLTSLPEMTGLRVEQIRIENGQVDVDAEVVSVGDAGRLADALGRQGFAMDPPSTEQRSPMHVAVRLHGSLSASGKARPDANSGDSVR
jgi:hypothetical protein